MRKVSEVRVSSDETLDQSNQLVTVEGGKTGRERRIRHGGMFCYHGPAAVAVCGNAGNALQIMAEQASSPGSRPTLRLAVLAVLGGYLPWVVLGVLDRIPPAAVQPPSPLGWPQDAAEAVRAVPLLLLLTLALARSGVSATTRGLRAMGCALGCLLARGHPMAA